MNLELNSPDDCPLRGGRDGNECSLNLALICDGYNDSYPRQCPLIDGSVLISRKKTEANNDS